MEVSKKIVIIDYQLGNLFSVNQALTNIGLNTIITSDPAEILTADAIVLPGVGAFGDAMNNLKELNLIQPIINFISSGRPFLGICLGLQLLFRESEEFGTINGLNVIKGRVLKFRNDKPIKVPQIAWNQIFPDENRTWKDTPLSGTREGEYVYFVHSYYVEPEENVTLTLTEYGGIKYTSSLLKDNIFACQFHPEKSAGEGLKIYKKWAEINNLYN